MQKYNVYASRSNECAYLATDDSPSIPAEPVYLARDVDAALAVKHAEIAKLAGLLRQCREILRSSPAHQGREYVTLGVAVNNAIDAHQEPKP